MGFVRQSDRKSGLTRKKGGQSSTRVKIKALSIESLVQTGSGGKPLPNLELIEVELSILDRETLTSQIRNAG